VNTKVVVISLPDATGRRAAFTQRARGATLAWSFFEAHTELAPGLIYDPDAAIIARARPMYPGELGCYSSHYAAWTMFLQSGAEQMLVLEDDTIVDWGFLAKLAEVDLHAAGISYLRLFAKRPCAFRKVLHHAVEWSRSLIEYLDTPFGTQGYVITREGAQRFIQHCRSIRRPLDHELDRSWDHGVPSLCIFPFPILEESTASSIGPARFEPFEIPARLRWRRYRMKMAERALKLRFRLRVLAQRGPSPFRSLDVG
jgi:glycosyl transferase family 25